MSAPYDCFEKIIGLADTSCPCFTTGAPSDASESASGLQLGATPGLNMDVINAAVSCYDGDLWSLLEAARTEGIKRTKMEVQQYIGQHTQYKRAPVRSQVGDTQNSRADYAMDKDYHGVSLTLAHHVGGYARIKRIGTFMKFTGTIDVDLYGLDDTAPEDTVTLNTTDGVLTWNTVDIELSMETEGSRNPQFWFLYEPETGQRYYNSRIHCGCAGKPKYGGSPWFESDLKQNGEAWMKWAMAGGVKGDTLSDRYKWTMQNETMGLVFDIEFGCNTSTVICNGNPDYENDMIQMSMAYAVQFAAASYLVNSVITSSKVNRETLTGGDAYGKLLGQYEAKFYEHAHGYIGATLTQPHDDGDPHSGVNRYSDCYTCKDKRKMKVSTKFR